MGKAVSLFLFFCILALSQRKNLIYTRHNVVCLHEWAWNDIADLCEGFLGPKKFEGVQILLPLTSKLLQNDMNQRLSRHLPITADSNASFEEQALANMIKRCNAVKVRIYVAGMLNNLMDFIDDKKRYSFRNFLKAVSSNHADDGNENISSCKICTNTDCIDKKHTRLMTIDYINHLVDMEVAGFKIDVSQYTRVVNWVTVHGDINDLNTDHGFGVNSRPLFYADFENIVTLTHRDTNFLHGRNTIVHLFEWKWDDIADECENILGPKGYAGVQISPPNENQVITTRANRPWWERYQPVSYKLNTRSGDEPSLARMIRRCNTVGIRIYADVVFNHMAAVGGTGTDGTSCNPCRKDYPGVPFTIDNFHATCAVNNYNDATNVRNCELVHLKDLDQSQEYVRLQIVQYLNRLVSLGVAGFRVDAAKHMWPSDLRAIYRRVNDLSVEHGFPKGTRPFFYQEVIDYGGEAVKKQEYTGFGAVLEFKFGYELGNAFQGNNLLKYLKNWGPEWGLLDGRNAVAFIDNHDNQRGTSDAILTYKKPKQYRMAIAFMLAHPYGTTRIMSSFQFDSFDQGPPNNNGNIIGPGTRTGFCTNGWVCEHRWHQISNMIGFRNTVEGTPITRWWDNGHNQIAFGRGQRGFIVFTSDGDIVESIKTDLPTGTYCDVISGSSKDGVCTGKSVEVDANGYISVALRGNEEDGVLAIHVNAKL